MQEWCKNLSGDARQARLLWTFLPIRLELHYEMFSQSMICKNDISCIILAYSNLILALCERFLNIIVCMSWLPPAHLRKELNFPSLVAMKVYFVNICRTMKTYKACQNGIIGVFLVYNIRILCNIYELKYKFMTLWGFVT